MPHSPRGAGSSACGNWPSASRDFCSRQRGACLTRGCPPHRRACLPAPPMMVQSKEKPVSQAICRTQSPREEIANSLSHGFGALAAAVFSPQLIENALRAGWVEGLAASVYCASMILLFSVSAAYHWLPRGGTKDLLRRLDHAAIFLFIAGSYT